MEVAIIDWKNLDSRFVWDDVYEHINAPQWFDFSAADASIDDESWFCRPGCNHPKTVEDFYRQTPPNSKKSSGLSKRVPFAELTKRDSTLKKRGFHYAPIFPNDSKSEKNVLDNENQNPNLSTPSNHKSKAIKSSAEKKQVVGEKTVRKEQSSRTLKSTLSARNLFGGGDILSKVTEFCTELKKLTMRTKDDIEQNSEVCVGDTSSRHESRKLDVKEKETKAALLEANPDIKCKAPPKSNMLEKPQRKIRYADENTPVKVDTNIIKRSEEVTLLQIRTCPPTPQCISATREPSKASPPLKAINPMTPPERGILHDTGYRKLNSNKDQGGGCQNNQRGGGQGQASIVMEKETKGLDVFWFLKPCRISS